MSKTKEYNSINWNGIFIEDSSSPSGLIWKIRPSQNIKAGDTAGCLRDDKKTGYQCFKVQYNKFPWLVHRILHVMRNGSIADDLDIDHIDGNGLNNSAENLRLVSAAVNMRNQKQHDTNSTGVTGVSFKITKGYTYVRARWNSLYGNQESKQFSCSKLGLIPAFAAACAYREKMIEQLNEAGAGYSERHGE